jgi:hypothetical protein
MFVRFITSVGITDTHNSLVLQPFQPKLHMTEEDFLSITHNGQLCDSEGGLGLKEFDHVMRDQVPVCPPQTGFYDDGLRSGGRHSKTGDECTFPFPHTSPYTGPVL